MFSCLGTWYPFIPEPLLGSGGGELPPSFLLASLFGLAQVITSSALFSQMASSSSKKVLYLSCADVSFSPTGMFSLSLWNCDFVL